MTGILLAILAVTSISERSPVQQRQRCRGIERNARGCTSYAFEELAPPNGAGMSGPCACTNVASVKGTPLVTTRASNITCQKGADTSIANGDWVVCGNNLPAVGIPAADGQLMLLAEGPNTNLVTQSAAICGAPWADVGTPACSSNQGTGPFGTATMDQITDDAAGAFEGRSVTITTASATRHTFYCAVKSTAGATSASVTIVGTGSAAGDCTGTQTGLNASTSKIVECTSPAAYAGTLTSVVATVRVGTVVGDTGTLLIEACDYKVAAPKRTSHVPTAGSTASRAAVTMTLTPTWPTSNSISIAGTFFGPTPISADAATVFVSTGFASLFNESGGMIRWFTGTAGQVVAIAPSTSGIRWWAMHTGSNRSMAWGANTASGADADADNKFGAVVDVAGGSFGGVQPDGWVGAIEIDADPGRAR